MRSPAVAGNRRTTVLRLSGRFGHGGRHDRPPAPAPLHPRDRRPEGAGSRGRLEHPRSAALAYSPDSQWRNRGTFVTGRAEIVEFLTAKWARERECALRRDLWAFDGNRIAVRFQYECQDTDGQCRRAYGNELWEFDEHGLMTRREASINDVPIEEN